MSEKATCMVFDVTDEDDDLEVPVEMTVTADYMFTRAIYLGVGGHTWVIPNQWAREMARFILQEAGE